MEEIAGFLDWICILSLISQTVGKSFRKKVINSTDVSLLAADSTPPTIPLTLQKQQENQYEVNVWLDPPMKNIAVNPQYTEDDFPYKFEKPEKVPFYKEYFMGIFVGSCALLFVVFCLCWLRHRERKYGYALDAMINQKRSDLRVARGGPSTDPQGYKDSVQRLRNSGTVQGDYLIVPGFKGSAMIRIHRPEDLTPGISSAYRGPVQSNSASGRPFQCKLKCAGGNACGTEGSRGAAKRQQYEMASETYRSAV